MKLILDKHLYLSILINAENTLIELNKKALKLFLYKYVIFIFQQNADTNKYKFGIRGYSSEYKVS